MVKKLFINSFFLISCSAKINEDAGPSSFSNSFTFCKSTSASGSCNTLLEKNSNNAYPINFDSGKMSISLTYTSDKASTSSFTCEIYDTAPNTSSTEYLGEKVTDCKIQGFPIVAGTEKKAIDVEFESNKLNKGSIYILVLMMNTGSDGNGIGGGTRNYIASE